MLIAAAGASPDPAIWHWGAQWAGRIVLVSDGADRPVGAVALRKHAA
jgi:hypothetical protein